MFNTNKYNDDLELEKAIKSLQTGSAEAFHLLYQKYHNKVYRFCLRMLGSESAAKDAFQETFIKVYEKRTSFRGENFSAWLFTIARHTCLNTIRSKREHSSFDETFHLNENPKRSDVALKDCIDKAIQQLPDSMRETFILREYEDFTYKEIAEMSGIDVSLAKVRVFRARKILRKLLKPIVEELNEFR